MAERSSRWFRDGANQFVDCPEWDISLDWRVLCRCSATRLRSRSSPSTIMARVAPAADALAGSGMCSNGSREFNNALHKVVAVVAAAGAVVEGVVAVAAVELRLRQRQWIASRTNCLRQTSSNSWMRATSNCQAWIKSRRNRDQVVEQGDGPDGEAHLQRHGKSVQRSGARRTLRGAEVSVVALAVAATMTTLVAACSRRPRWSR